MGAKQAGSGLSLVDFVKAKKRADCPVCALPETIKEQLAGASDKKIRRPDIVEWLNKECGAAIKLADLERHINARHAA